ncbi:MAG: deoxyguanosinetriphosphate triphosphohydrolase [Alphaproteobacteria bacterium]|nr:deoxyguanosinetriphosphate triphosphohydrolase [Alphaproteobacteria bacterium]
MAAAMGLNDYGAGLKPGERFPGRYAANAVPSRGREHAEPECPMRSPFQRDRDRIIHSAPFRRLLHKTQVFVFHEGDHYRTRLTHSLEVAQIARTIARQLRLDEDLAEALALAHDLGHSPFGHAGERALGRAMTDFGGFDHNAQSLKVVMRLERKYRGFDGMNLTWETLEGLAKHNGPIHEADPSNERPDDMPPINPVWKVALLLRGLPDLELWTQASAEAQVAALADDIAYVSHDVDDGLRAHLLDVDQLVEAPFTDVITKRVLAQPGPILERSRAIYEITRTMITLMVQDCVAESRRRLAALSPASPDEIRAALAPVVAFSEPVATDIARLKAMLFVSVYRHDHVMRVMDGAEEIVRDLFGRYLATPAEMPDNWRQAARSREDRRLARLVCDFVAGMTDRMAMAEHRRLFDDTPELR